MLLKSSLNVCIGFLESFPLYSEGFIRVCSKFGSWFKITFSTVFQMSCCFFKFLYPLSQIGFIPSIYLVLLPFRKEEKRKGIYTTHSCSRRCGDGHIVRSGFTAGNKSLHIQIVAKSSHNRHQKH